MREMEDAIGLKDNDGGVLTAGQLRAIERNEVKRLSCISRPSRSLCLPARSMRHLGVHLLLHLGRSAGGKRGSTYTHVLASTNTHTSAGVKWVATH